MKFLLDQDVYYSSYRFLKNKNYDVIRVSDIGLSTADDIIILKESNKLNRILITRDKGFGSLVFFSELKSTGIILLRLEPKESEKIHKVLLEVLETYSFEQLQKYFITIDPDKYRTRKII